MEIWSKCDICGRDIPVGELCHGLKKGICICKDCCTGFENCTFTLAPAPALTPPNEWVSVEDTVPDPGERVLATDGIFVGEAYRSSANSWFRHTGFPWRDGVTGRTVRFWMPMPSSPDRRPPEGEEDT